jgi:hypothetical protein
MCCRKRDSCEVGAGSEKEIESGGEDEEQDESKGHWEKVGEPASAPPEIGDVLDVSFLSETRVDGAKGNDSDDANGYDDGSLVDSEDLERTMREERRT